MHDFSFNEMPYRFRALKRQILICLLFEVRSVFMVHDDDDSGDLPELSNRELLRLLMQEIVDTRNELKREFKDELTRVDCRIDAFASNMLTLASEVHTLHTELHQNQSAFIKNHDTLDERVKKLEEVVFL